MRRRFKVLLALGLVVVVLVVALVLALPEIVRRTAVGQITALTGRTASIERVELNLLTGRFAVDRLRVARRAGRAGDPFVEFERLDGRVALSALFGFDIRLAELRLTRPAVRITRTGPAEFDFADLLEIFRRPVAKDEPSRLTFTLDRLELVDGLIVMDDAFLSPPVAWRLSGLGIEAGAITTKRDRPAGTLRVGARLGATTLQASSQSIQLTPFSMSLDASIAGFDLAGIRPYLPPDVPVLPESGKVGAALRLERVRAGDALGESSVSGEVTIEGLAVAQRDRPAPFLRLGRAAVDIERIDFLGRDVRIAAVDLDGLHVTVARDAEGAIDLLAMLQRSGPPSPEPDAVGKVTVETPRATEPSDPGAASPRSPPPRVRLAKVGLTSGAVTFIDEAVSPPREWTLDGVTVTGAGFSTSPDDPPATLDAQLAITARPGATPPATVSVRADTLRLAPLAAAARVKVDSFALAAVRPYWPATAPAFVSQGTLGVTLDAALERGADGQLSRATASGHAQLAGIQVAQRGQTTPYLTIPSLAVGLKQVDAVAQTVAVDAIDVIGADLRVVREQGGHIALLAMAPAAEPAIEQLAARTGLRQEDSPAKPPPPPASAPWRVDLEKFTFAKGTLTFEDRDVSPATALTLGDVSVEVRRLAWPFTRPAAFSLALTMPGGGRTDGKGTAVLEPLNVQISLSTREAPIEPYQSYFPFAARMFGFFSGDSLSEVQRGPAGELVLASRGTAWASNLAVRAPGVHEPVMAMDAMVIRGIDFSWPSFALVDRVVLTHPQVRVERDAEGGINLRALFAPRDGADGTTDAAAPATAGAEAPAKPGDAPPSGGGGPMQTMVIDFKEISVESGFGRFIDHTTKPPFAEDISRLALTIKDLSNVFGRSARTTMTAQALIGKDAALDMRGDVSGLGETLRADLIAELRDFALSTANPYADALTSWTIKRGKLQAKIHYQVEGDRITAQHELEFEKLQVAKSSATSDEAKRKIGVPLGLAVALLKDSDGNIDFSLPLTGTLSDKNFNWGELIWAGVKQVLVKVLLSPFSAVGRLFKGSDDSVEQLEVDPVTFAPGSAVIAPSTEGQLTKLAEFLRRSPNIKLSLAPVVTQADVASLKDQEVAARLEAFRQAERLPDLPAALRAYYKQHYPDTVLPKTTAEQMAWLVGREPVPEARLAALVERRLEATRENLVAARGIAEARVVAAEARSPAAPVEAGQGRVEFTIVAADG